MIGGRNETAPAWSATHHATPKFVKMNVGEIVTLPKINHKKIPSDGRPVRVKAIVRIAGVQSVNERKAGNDWNANYTNSRKRPNGSDANWENAHRIKRRNSTKNSKPFGNAWRTFDASLKGRAIESTRRVSARDENATSGSVRNANTGNGNTGNGNAVSREKAIVRIVIIQNVNGAKA
jgi:hypothetical protein